MTATRLFVVVIGLALASSSAFAEAESNPETRTSGALTSVVTAALAEGASYEVLTAAELRNVLSLDAQRQLAGCIDESCMPDISAALGSRYAVFGHLDRVGDLLILNLSLFDTEEARVVRRASVTGEDEAALVDSARTAAGGIAAVLEERGAERVLVLDVTAPPRDPALQLLAIAGISTAITGAGLLGLSYLATALFTTMVMTSIRNPDTRPLAFNFIPVVGALIGPFASPRDYGDMLFIGLGVIQVVATVIAGTGTVAWLVAPEGE